jgi:hypothetical protein
MPFAAIGRQPILDASQPDIETMCAWDLESEVAVCRYYQDYHKAEGNTRQAFDWYRRRCRVQELLARKVGVSA